MKNLIITAALLVGTVFAYATTNTSKFELEVREQQSQKTVPYAQLVVVDENGQEVINDYTDDEGYYDLSVLAKGAYKITVSTMLFDFDSVINVEEQGKLPIVVTDQMMEQKYTMLQHARKSNQLNQLASQNKTAAPEQEKLVGDYLQSAVKSVKEIAENNSKK